MNLLEREEFVLLAEIAVTEKDPEDFIRILKKRNTYIGRIIKEDPDVLRGDMEECLRREKLILQRLESERRKIIEQMEKLSKNKKAVATYAARYPFPSMPRFVDRDG
jgi:hypothetical protein